MSAVTVIYRGQLAKGYNGEESDLLGLYCKRTHDTEILAEKIKDDIDQYGNYLSVRYWITDTPINRDEAEQMLALQVLGYGDVDYGMRYSDCTGYLWTDEQIMVGGHDLLRELSDHMGKFLVLEIKYDSKPRGKPLSQMVTY
jgi:hypothetical protein